MRDDKIFERLEQLFGENVEGNRDP